MGKKTHFSTRQVEVSWESMEVVTCIRSPWFLGETNVEFGMKATSMVKHWEVNHHDEEDCDFSQIINEKFDYMD